MTTFKKTRKKKHKRRVKDTKLLTMKFVSLFRNCKSKRIKFHNYEINLPSKMNPLFSNVKLEKESEIANFFFVLVFGL